MAAETEYPLPAFHFQVSIDGASGETSFQEVSGISSELSIEELPEGGENRFVHHLPTGVKHGNLVLKRGIGSSSSPLVKKCVAVFNGDFATSFEPCTVRVFLLDEKASPIRGWIFFNAIPIKWDTEGFNSTKNEVAIETIELSYSYSIRSK